jgi:hypothetical protein
LFKAILIIDFPRRWGLSKKRIGKHQEDGVIDPIPHLPGGLNNRGEIYISNIFIKLKM